MNSLKSDFYREPEFIRFLKDTLKWIHKTTGKSGFVDPVKMIMYGTLYIILYGERSNGKTFAALLCAIIRYILYGDCFSIVRRWDVDFNTKTFSNLFGAFEKYHLIEHLTNGEWTHIAWKSHMFYLATYDEKGHEVLNEKPIGYAFALTAMEHDKGGTYPDNNTTIIFDEFLTRGAYLPNEMALWENVISTIVRDDGDAKVWMLGNTVSPYCPYFREMGLKHIKEMEIGDVQQYQGVHEDCTIVVHWADGLPNGKKTDKYFAFDSDHTGAQMITQGKWETAIYPHCPYELHDKDKVFVFFIIFDGETLQCAVYADNNNEFIYVKPHTSEIRYKDETLIYTSEIKPQRNYRRRINRPTTPIEQGIWELFRTEKVFYLDNTCGEVVRVYLQWCTSERVV